MSEQFESYERVELPEQIKGLSEVEVVIPKENSEDLAEFLSQSFKNEPHLLSQEPESFLETFRKRLAVVLINENSELVGFARLVEVGFMENTETQVYELGGVYIAPEFRGNGYSHELYSSILYLHREKLIQCTTTNPKALRSSTRATRKVLGDISTKEFIPETDKYLETLIVAEDEIIRSQFLIPVPFNALSRNPQVHQEICCCPFDKTSVPIHQNPERCAIRNMKCVMRGNVSFIKAFHEDILLVRANYRNLGLLLLNENDQNTKKQYC